MKILRLFGSGNTDDRTGLNPVARRVVRVAPGCRPTHPTAAAGVHRAGLLGGQRGAAAVQVLLSIAVGLLFTLTLTNALLMLYGRAALQHAADAGARAGSRAGDGNETAVCQRTADRVIADLAALYVSHAAAACRLAENAGGGELVAAVVQADLPPVFDGLGPRWNFTIRSASVREPGQ